MQLPKNNTLTRKLINAMPKDRGVARSHFPDLMISVGYNADAISSARGRLVKSGYIVESGASFCLSAGVLKNFQPKEEPALIIDKFRPLNQAYMSAMRRAARLDDGHKVMTFLPMLSS